MECDRILELGNGTTYTIKRESSLEELDSLEQIVNYLIKDDSEKLRELLDELPTTTVKINKDQKFFLNHELLSNCSFENLVMRYPNEMELIKDLKEPYHITLLDKAYINGEEFKGRAVINGIVTYIFRNEYDVKKFAETEYKKQLLKKAIIDGKLIDVNYLNPKYQNILEILAKYYKFNSINELVEDYLDNKNNYNDIIEYKDEKGVSHKISSRAKLNDFCRELNNETVYDSETESALAGKLRFLHYKREEFTKKDLYNTLKEFFTNLTISEEQFIHLNKDEMNTLLKDLFKNDLIMSQFEVDFVEKSYPQIKFLNKRQKKALFDKVLKIKNEELKNNNRTLLDENSVKLETKEALLEFYEGFLSIEIDGKSYSLEINDNLDFVYKKEELDDSKIKLKRIRTSFKNQFNLDPEAGYETLKVFQPVNRDGIIDGQFEGFYIYEHINLNQEKEYIISQSILHPNLFGVTIKGSLNDAKLEVRSRNRSMNVLKATKLGLKQRNNQRYVNLNFRTNSGQTIESINYSLDPNFELPAPEYNLLNINKMNQIIDFYRKEFNIDISDLNTPELIGTFIAAIAEQGYTIQFLDKEITQEIRQKIEKIKDTIKGLEKKQYLVERYVELNDGIYQTYLKSITDSELIVNSTGEMNSQLPDISLTESLYNLAKALENTILKDTGITVEITNNQKLKDMKDDNGNPLFESVDKIRAFLHNNSIYINQNKASIQDLIHETLHIMLGVLKVKDYNKYKNLIEYYESTKIKRTDSLRKQVKETYKNLAYEDQIEELVVIHWSRHLEKGSLFYFSDQNHFEKELENLSSEFNNLYRSIQKNIKNKERSDFEFGSYFSDSNMLNDMQKQRKATNAIQIGILSETIIKDCK